MVWHERIRIAVAIKFTLFKKDDSHMDAEAIKKIQEEYFKVKGMYKDFSEKNIEIIESFLFNNDYMIISRKEYKELQDLKEFCERLEK